MFGGYTAMTQCSTTGLVYYVRWLKLRSEYIRGNCAPQLDAVETQFPYLKVHRGFGVTQTTAIPQLS